MSSNYFSSYFRKFTNISFSDYVTRLRVNLSLIHIYKRIHVLNCSRTIQMIKYMIHIFRLTA